MLGGMRLLGAINSKTGQGVGGVRGEGGCFRICLHTFRTFPRRHPSNIYVDKLTLM